MSTEEFEKLHEMYKSLYDEVKTMPERAQSYMGFYFRNGFYFLLRSSKSNIQNMTVIISGNESVSVCIQLLDLSVLIFLCLDFFLGGSNCNTVCPNLTESNLFLSCHYRLITNKLLLSVIIIMELVILAGVVYLKFFRK
uniref:Uncharacterized protein n=1 Tax=Sinocyclocheilus grahami TaxID=75366 RepID=A0A672Q1B4_SINGR